MGGLGIYFLADVSGNTFGSRPHCGLGGRNLVGGDDMVRVIRILELSDYIIRIIRFFVPWIVRIILFMLSSILTSIITFWRGVPTTTSRIADEWLDRAFLAGFPSVWHPQLYWTFRVLALVMIVFGWVISSYITVWAINLIF